MLIIRRFAHRPDALNPLGVLVIGVALNGEHFRITCEGLTAAEQERMRALLTLGLVEPERDESQGALRHAVADLAWLTWNGMSAEMLFIRRARLWAAADGGDAWLWIGVEFDGVPYRIACAPTGPEMRPRVVREVAALGVADRCFWPSRTGGFHAVIIGASRWASVPALEGGFCVAGRTMSRALPLARPGGVRSGWAIGA